MQVICLSAGIVCLHFVVGSCVDKSKLASGYFLTSPGAMTVRRAEGELRMVHDEGCMMYPTWNHTALSKRIFVLGL